MLALSLSASAFVAPGLAPRLPSADFGMTHGSRLANLQMVQARAQLFGTILSAAHSALGCARNSLFTLLDSLFTGSQWRLYPLICSGRVLALLSNPSTL